MRPQRKNEHPPRQGQNAFQAHAQPPDRVETATLTHAQIREMFNNSVSSAFTSMGINGLFPSPTTFAAFHSSTALSTYVTPSTWFLDSGASNHTTSVEHNLENPQPYAGNETITTANGHQLSISGIGFLDLPITSQGSLTLSNVYFAPHLSANLISVGQLVECGYLVNFSPSGCVIQERQTGKVIGTESKHGRLFLLDKGHSSLFASSMASSNNVWTTWHRRLGHLHNASLILYLSMVV